LVDSKEETLYVALPLYNMRDKHQRRIKIAISNIPNKSTNAPTHANQQIG